MSGIDAIVRRLAEITDELLALGTGDFADRYRLETERDALRAQATQFHHRKDELKTTDQLNSELDARRDQLNEIRSSFINRALQAAADAGGGGGGGGCERAIGAEYGGTLNNAMMTAQGGGSIIARIAEIEQELARR